MKSPTEKCCEFIRILMSEHGMRQIAVEDKCGIPRGSIGKWLTNDRKSLSAENVSRVLLAFPELSADWMMRDEANYPMLGSPEKSERERTLEEENQSLRAQLDAAQQYISVLLKSR